MEKCASPTVGILEAIVRPIDVCGHFFSTYLIPFFGVMFGGFSIIWYLEAVKRPWHPITSDMWLNAVLIAIVTGYFTVMFVCGVCAIRYFRKNTFNGPISNAIDWILTVLLIFSRPGIIGYAFVFSGFALVLFVLVSLLFGFFIAHVKTYLIMKESFTSIMNAYF